MLQLSIWFVLQNNHGDHHFIRRKFHPSDHSFEILPQKIVYGARYGAKSSYLIRLNISKHCSESSTPGYFRSELPHTKSSNLFWVSIAFTVFCAHCTNSKPSLPILDGWFSWGSFQKLVIKPSFFCDCIFPLPKGIFYQHTRFLFIHLVYNNKTCLTQNALMLCLLKVMGDWKPYGCHPEVIRVY